MDEKKIVLLDTLDDYMKKYTSVLCNKENGIVTGLIGDVVKNMSSEEVSEGEFNSYYNSKLSEIVNG